MPVHDEYARVTPYELLLPDPEFADRRFPAILAEAEERNADLGDPERFALLGEAGAVLRALRGEEGDPQRIHQFGILLFHAFHFWREGLPLFHLETGVVRYLAETGPESEGWSASLPGPAGYVQLPQHLFWVPGDEDSAPESVDGFFWSAPDRENVSLLVAMGLRRDRPGISVVPLPTLPVESAGEWASVEVRPGGRDFQSSLPGAELENLYALEAGAEAVKFAMRVFWYLDTFPGTLAAEEVPHASGVEEAIPTPTELGVRRIVLKAD
jgi:hypothetical protein